jgi:VanZ family protein
MKLSNNSSTFITNQVRDRRTHSLIPPEQIPKGRCSYLNLKPKSHFITPPSSKVISSRPSTGRNLGPGKYLIPAEEGNSFEFNRSARFSSNSKNLYLVVSALFKKVSPQEKEEISKRIEKNKDFAVLSLDLKNQMAKVRAFQSNVRASVTKLTKEKIYQMTQKKKEDLLREKFKKFDYRMNIDVWFK